jgi:hypothetical protein
LENITLPGFGMEAGESSWSLCDTYIRPMLISFIVAEAGASSAATAQYWPIDCFSKIFFRHTGGVT